MTTVKRKIYFYRADVGADDDGRPLPFDAQTVLKEVKKAKSKRIEESNGSHRVGWVDAVTGSQKLRLATVRRTELPELEEAETLSPLPLTQAQGLAETVHVVFFGDNIAGSDFNFYGPRMSAVANFLDEKSSSCPSGLRFERLLRGDAMERLNALEGLTLVKLRARPSYAAELARASRDLGAMLESAGNIGNAEEAEIILRSRPRSKRALDGMLRMARRLIGLSGVRDNLSKLEVSGIDSDTGRIRGLDLLSDALVQEEEIVAIDGRSRAVSPGSAYEAIQRAHRRLKRQIDDAASVFET